MSKEGFVAPRPSRAAMRLSGVLNERALLFGLPGIRKIPLLRNIPPLGGYFKVSKIVISESDEAVLRTTTDPKNAFFITPNHPEFTTDWLIDKYISDRYAPRMSSWAASSIINGPLGSFWSANNLIGNDGGEQAKNYSIECALAGHGTLLHPEGTVRWRSDKIFELLPGAVDMAISAAHQSESRGDKRRVYVLPLVWKIVYDSDIEKALLAGVASLEKALSLPVMNNLSLAERYVRFYQNLLASQMRKFNKSCASELPSISDATKFFDEMLGELIEKYQIEKSAEHIHKILHRLYKKTRAEKNRMDTGAVIELQRLAAYSVDTFEKDFFYQEEIAEGLQFIRQVFLTGGYDSVRSMLPKPFGWRTVYLRVVEPIDVSSAIGQGKEDAELSAELLQELKTRMSRELEGLNADWGERRKVWLSRS